MLKKGSFGIRKGRQRLPQNVWRVATVEGNTLKVNFWYPSEGKFLGKDIRDIPISDAEELTEAQVRALGINP